MSNDTKFWIARLVMFFCIVLDLSILLKAGSALLSGAHSSATVLFVLFFAIACIGMIAGVVYYRYKAQRWDPTFNQDEANKIAIETLAKLGEKSRKQ